MGIEEETVLLMLLNSTLIEKRFMNKQIKWHGSCLEMYAAAFYIAAF